MDDLDHVPLGDLGGRVFGARHHLAVALHRHRPLGQPEQLDEPPHRERRRHVARFPVHRDVHGFLTSRITKRAATSGGSTASPASAARKRRAFSTYPAAPSLPSSAWSGRTSPTT